MHIEKVFDGYRLFQGPVNDTFRIYDGNTLIAEMAADTHIQGYHEPVDDDPHVDSYAACVALVLDGLKDKPVILEDGTMHSSLYGFVTPINQEYDGRPIWLARTLCVNVLWLMTPLDATHGERIIGIVQQWIENNPDHGCSIEEQYTGSPNDYSISGHVLRFQSLRHMAAFRLTFPFPI